jgi:AraC family transcriptional regulator
VTEMSSKVTDMSGHRRIAPRLTAAPDPGCAAPSRLASRSRRPGVDSRQQTTEHVRTTAVFAAIDWMRDQLGEPQELRDFARAALMSPFHFHRVFRAVTATTPGRFLTALRMSQARQLLLETDLSATDISIAVGYSSFGTFTTQFTKLIGVSPGRFRARAAAIGDVSVRELLESYSPCPRGSRRGARGWVGPRPDGSPGIAVVGLFPSRIAQEPPLTCSVIEPPGSVRLPEVQPGLEHCEALAVSVATDASARQVLTGSPKAGLFVGAAEEPIDLVAGALKPFWIRLRPMRITDPPLLTAFPLLAAAPLPRASSGAVAGSRLPASGYRWRP